jgi:peptidoglycan hydrolase-like protein with peptidoglycan-binding domain
MPLEMHDSMSSVASSGGKKMTFHQMKIPRVAAALALSLFTASTLAAQSRLVLPEGSVIIVRTTSTLQSSGASVGQTFETTVVDPIGVDAYTVIPAGSRIRGVINYVQPATRSQSGVLGVAFDRITLSDGTSYAITGRLTSTDSLERRQIEAQADPRVVLVGGRGGIGAMIAGAGSDRSPTSGILGALGSLLSEGQNVRVPAGTQLAVQLEQQVVLRGRGNRRMADAFTIYTNADMVRSAQQALAQQGYYRGSINGVLDDATRSALFEYQVDRGMVATGNLNGRTAQALGLSTSVGVGAGSTFGNVLTPDAAGLVRRGAQSLVARQRQELFASNLGRLIPNRSLSTGDVEFWFALSAFADNSSLYEQLVAASGNNASASYAGSALIEAARRVDNTLSRARPSVQVQNAWRSLRRQLAGIDATYANSF